jgi:hypothetical protein
LRASRASWAERNASINGGESRSFFGAMVIHGPHDAQLACNLGGRSLVSDLTSPSRLSGPQPGRTRGAIKIAPLGAGSPFATGARRGADNQAHSLLAGTSQPNVGEAPAPPFSVWVL